MIGSRCSRLSATALGVAMGITSALWMILFTWAVWMGGVGTQIIDLWAIVIPGYSASLKGGLIGGAWGFIDGFIFGLIFSWIYNLCLCCCSRRGCCCGKPTCGACNEGKKCCCGSPTCSVCNPK